MKNWRIDIPDRKFKNLEDLLKKWINIHQSYSKIDDSDPLYWYNERANLSVLAGAVYNCNEFALEEVRADKKYGGNKWRGRCDLVFTWGKIDYAIESKQKVLSLGDRALDSSEHINKGILREARDDAKKVKMVADRYMGVAFIVPYIPKGQSKDTERLLERFIDEIDKVDYDLMAYVFPKNYRSLKNEHGYVYPGIVLVGRVPKRG